MGHATLKRASASVNVGGTVPTAIPPADRTSTVSTATRTVPLVSMVTGHATRSLGHVCVPQGGEGHAVIAPVPQAPGALAAPIIAGAAMVPPVTMILASASAFLGGVG